MNNIVGVFAGYVMRSRVHGMIVTASCAVLSLLIFPFVFPLSQLSAACVALVTLRSGARDGLITIAGATLITGGLALVSASQMSMAMDFILLYIVVIWGPVWLVSIVLRYTRAMDMALIAAAAMGILIVVGMHLSIGDLTAWWTQVLTRTFGPVLQNSQMSAEQGQHMIQGMAVHMTGSLAAGFVLGVMVSVFIARWWQAVLYNPGGFRKDFHNLRLDGRFATFSAVIAVASLLPLEKVTEVSHDIFIVIIAAYMLQGVALIHNMVAALQMHVAWLVVMYLMIVFLPPMRLLLAAAGYADGWIDFRPRIRARAGRIRGKNDHDRD